MSEIENTRASHRMSSALLVDGAETGGKLALIEIRVGQDTVAPVHRHHWDDEIVYVLEGDVIFHVDGERRPGPAGTCVLLPRGSEHSYVVESAEARLLIVVAPAGLERLFGEQCQSGRLTCPDLEWIVTIGARYGIEVTGPPPSPVRHSGHARADENHGHPAAPSKVGGSDVD